MHDYVHVSFSRRCCDARCSDQQRAIPVFSSVPDPPHLARGEHLHFLARGLLYKSFGLIAYTIEKLSNKLKRKVAL